MLERFTGDARGVLTGAREGALRLGHGRLASGRRENACASLACWMSFF